MASLLFKNLLIHIGRMNGNFNREYLIFMVWVRDSRQIEPVCSRSEAVKPVSSGSQASCFVYSYAGRGRQNFQEQGKIFTAEKRSYLM